MSQQLHPYFSLSGEFDPDEVTRLLQIQPSRVTRTGDPGRKGAIDPRLRTEWTWQPNDDDSRDVGDQLSHLARALSLRSEEVARLSKKFFGTIHVYNRIDGVKRDWFLSSETLRLLADLHVYIECQNVHLAHGEEAGSDAN
jgi:hypothetical protein